MPFDDLSDDDKLAQFKAAAEAALSQWRIPHARLELLSLRSNAVFAATYPEYPDDFQMVLRVNWPGRKTAAVIRCESIWLDILAKRWLPVPRVLRAATEIAVNDTAFVCTLFTYQPGEAIAPQDITETQARQVGTFAAALHSVETGIKQGGSFRRPRLDADGLFGAESPYASAAEAALLAPHRDTLDAVIGRVLEVFARYDALGDQFGLIHGDLKPDNLLFDADGLHVLDFDDCGWGYYPYDLAPFLLFVKPPHHRTPALSRGEAEHALTPQPPLPQGEGEQKYDVLKRALWEGYTHARPLPDVFFGDLETLVAGRFVASCRWVAAHHDHPAYRGKVEDILAERAARLAGFLRTGTL